MQIDIKQLIAVTQNDQWLEGCDLAQRLGLQWLNAEQSRDFPYLLQQTTQGLVIQQTGPKAAGPVLVDFNTGSSEHRRKQGGAELIAKAVGGSKQQRPTVLDATAGLGRDSFVLASRGYSVILCERSPLVAALLADGLHRASSTGDSELQTIIQRMTLQPIDACEYLQTEAIVNPPDTIVIDPMFPESKKSALVKKEMRAFHQLVGADVDSDKLLALALATATHRVVVKRPKKADFLMAQKPNFSVTGKAVRFDIYSLKAYEK